MGGWEGGREERRDGGREEGGREGEMEGARVRCREGLTGPSLEGRHDEEMNTSYLRRQSRVRLWS